jgi:hypothetical protein
MRTAFCVAFVFLRCASGPSEITDAGGLDAPSSSDAAPVEADADAEAGWVFAPTTSVAELTQNDTAACGSSAAPCTAAWTTSHSVKYSSGVYTGQTHTVDGFWDRPVSAGAQNPSSVNGYVSKVPVTALLPGHDVPVFVETQNWWGGGNGHIGNGEVSSNAAQIKNQIDDQRSRGFSGQIVDWYGQGTTADKALPAIKSNAEASGGQYRFAVMIDKGFFTNCGETVACLDGAIAYLFSNYTSSAAYLRDAGGHPIIFYFINQYYPTEYAILKDPSIDAKGTTFVMYEPNGFPKNDPPTR